MIFTTENKKIAIFGKTIDEVKKKWNDFVKSYKKEHKLFGEDGAFASLFSGKEKQIVPPKLLSEFEEFNKKFREEFEKSGITLEEFCDQSRNVNNAILDYAKNCKDGEMTTEGFVESVKGLSFAAKAAQNTLKAVGNMVLFCLIANGIEWVVNWIDNLIHSSEKCKERVDKLIDSYKSALDEANRNAKTVEDLADRYEVLSKGVNNLGKNVLLTTEEYSEYNDIVNQIAEMFPKLIQGYTDEGTAILSLKGNVEQLRDAYKDAQEEAYNLIISGENSGGNDIIENWKNLQKTGFWNNLFDFGADDVGGSISMQDALDQLKAFTEMSAEAYRHVDQVVGAGSREELAALTVAEKSVGYSSYISKALGVNYLSTDEEIEAAKRHARTLIQTYQAEIDSA